MSEVDGRWRESLAAAAARAYEAAHGSAIPETRRGLRLRMTVRQAIAACLGLAVLAGAGWWFTRPDAVVDIALTEPSGVSSVGAGTVVVDVAGAVEAPGLVTLAAGARVADAVDAAGGASADAVLDDLNLARRVQDGEQIVVASTADAADEADGLININRADATALESLPGVGPVLAERIVADREANGPFLTLEDLGRVAGVGDAVVSALVGVATV